MFSPESTLHSLPVSSLRNPRRRQRKDSDSFRQAPQRKRSKLADDTFTPPTNGKVNGNGAVSHNGYPAYSNGVNASHTLEIPLREKKSSTATKRASKGDGSTTLTRNQNYHVKKLPSFPERFKENPTEPFRAFVLQSKPYALTLTHDQAYIFEYTTSNHPAVPRTLPLPFNLKRSEPLPVGSVVHLGPSNEIGVVVVSPTTGKIVFWDNVDSAESLTLYQQRRQGVEGSVGNMLSGETVTDLIEAGPAGFILTFNTGRLAQLTVRDAQGRPKIEVLFIRVGGNANGGLFGSFRNVLTGSAWRRDIASVKTRPSEHKGQTEIITATKTATFQLWDLSWEGHHTFKTEVNIQSELLDTLKDGSAPESRSQHMDIQVVDFAVLPRLNGGGMELSTLAVGNPFTLGLLVLVAIKGPSSLSYALVEVDFIHENVSIRRFIPLYAYQQDDLSTDISKGSVLVPAPGHTAFVIFPQAIVIASLTEKDDSPEDQLLADSGVAPQPFQDVVYISKKAKLQFVGHAAEETYRKERDARCVIFARGFGIIRVNAVAPENVPEELRQRVTAKSKLEQAVFFGLLPGTIIDFTPRSTLSFEQEELEDAALVISHEIVGTLTDYLPSILPSIEQHLNMRSAALHTLATHLRSFYPPLSRNVKWQLLWNAEKLASATEIWKHYQIRQQSQDNLEPLLDTLLVLLHERYKTELRPQVGELDPVREWFIKDVSQLHIMVPWIYKAIKGVYDEGTKDNKSLIRIMTEGDSITLAALRTALIFREENLRAYGLEEEHITDGILERGYEGLPQIWTSTHNIVVNTKQLVDLAREVAFRCYENEDTSDVPDEALVRQVASENPIMVEICCLIHVERYRWCLASDEEKVRATGRSLRDEYEVKTRNALLTRLAKIGQVYEGMNLAEKFGDMPTLVELVSEEAYYLHSLEIDPEDINMQEEAREKLADIRKRIKRYFDVFGYDWAHAFFSSHIISGQAASLFEKDMTSEKYLTKFLRSDPSRARLSWINDIVNEKDLPAAASALMTVAEGQEPNTWCKKIEASLAKLALMAVKTDAHPDSARLEKLVKQNEMDLKIITVQELLYKYIKPLVLESLDDDAALEQCLLYYCRLIGPEKPALRQIVRQGFEDLIGHRTMEAGLLIDVLTLINAHEETFEQRVGKTQFMMALEVLDASWEHLEPKLRDMTHRLIWKRAFLQDDWEAINDTKGRSDDEVEANLQHTVLFSLLRESGKATDSFKSLSRFSPLEPEDCLGAGCTSEDLISRFPSEDLRDPIAADNMVDDELLSRFIEASRLSHWFAATKTRAEESLFADAQREVEKLGREREFLYKVMTDRGEGVVDDGTESYGSSASGDGSGVFGDDERIPGGRFDEEGDVEME